MANIATFYPSRYIKAGHLNGDAVLTIKSAAREDVDFDGKTEPKLLITFTTPVCEDGPQRLIVNKTNAQNIAKATGSSDTDDWPGKRVELYATTVSAFGDEHDVVRIRSRAPVDDELGENSVPF